MKKLLPLFIFLFTSVLLTAQMIIGEALYIQDFNYQITLSSEGQEIPLTIENTMTLDLDGNGEIDMTFRLQMDNSGGLSYDRSVECGYDSTHVKVCQECGAFIIPFEEGDEFDAGCDASCPTDNLPYYQFISGESAGMMFTDDDGSMDTTYLAFRYDFLGEEMLGWVKFGYNNASWFRLYSIGTQSPLDSQIGGDFTSSNSNIIQNTNIPIHPNPTQDVVSIDYSEFSQAANLKIYNSIGQEIQQDILKSGEKYSTSLAAHPAGLYYFVIENETQKVIKKVILSR